MKMKIFEVLLKFCNILIMTEENNNIYSMINLIIKSQDLLI